MRQTGPGWESIVIDNRSTDGTGDDLAGVQDCLSGVRRPGSILNGSGQKLVGWPKNSGVRLILTYGNRFNSPTP